MMLNVFNVICLGACTSKDGLVNTQSCGFDGSDSDISRDFITNCRKEKTYIHTLYYYYTSTATTSK